MKLLQYGMNIPELREGTVATIGNFDGLHLGHQALLSAMISRAAEANLPRLVILFEPQSREFFLNDRAPPRLTTLRKKLQLLNDIGVDYVYCLRFNRRLALMSATEFARTVIFSRLRVKYLYVGRDFRFGCDRQGDNHLLAEIASSYRAQLEIYPDVVCGPTKISSTNIRAVLNEARLEEAERLLGRVFSLCGRVVQGDARGRLWGIPTANLRITQRTLPLKGVFFVRVRLQEGTVYTGVANIGCRPTVDGHRNVLEVHILGYEGSLYGQRLEVFFLHKLRDEVTFSSKEALIAQIHADVASAAAYFLECDRHE